MSKRVTIRDISNEIGVSTTIITRALNGKPKVSEELRKKIIDLAKEMGYKPNKTAQALSRKEIVLGIVYPIKPYEFFSYIEDGMNKGIYDLLDFRVKGIFKPVKDQNATEETIKALSDLQQRRVDGIIISPGVEYKEYRELVSSIENDGIPIVFLLNDMQNGHGIGCVKLNGIAAGKMASQFLKICLPDNRPVVVFSGNKEVSIHKECIKGFLEESEGNLLTVKGVYETQEDKKIAYYLTEKVINDIPNLGGIYVSSANSVAVCNCLEDYGKTNEIIVIGQDLYPDLVRKLETGSLKATLFQDPYEQGRKSIHKIYRYLTESEHSKGDICTTPILVLKSVVDCYHNNYITSQLR